MSVDKTPSWKERADDLAREMRLDAEIARLSRPGMLAAEMAEALPEDLRSAYWRRKLDAYFDQETRPDPYHNPRRGKGVYGIDLNGPQS